MFKCLATVIILAPGMEMLPEDKVAIERHREGCVVKYPMSPCLKRWYKLSDLNYRAICSPPVPQQETIDELKDQDVTEKVKDPNE